MPPAPSFVTGVLVALASGASACLTVSQLADEGVDAAPGKDAVAPGRDATRDAHDAASDGAAREAAVDATFQNDARETGAADARKDVVLADVAPPEEAEACPGGGGATRCGSVCVSLATSSTNCGACGRVCTSGLGPPGACESGMCNVQAFATGQDFPTGVAVYGNTVYWSTSTGGTVVRAPTNAGAVVGMDTTVTLASGEGSPFAVEVSDAGVFWTDNSSGQVMQVGLDGGTRSTLVTAQTHASGLAVAGSDLYWASTGIGTITAYTPPAAVSTLATGETGAIGVAINETNVFFTDGYNLGHSVRTKSRMVLGGGIEVTISSGASDGGTAANPSGIAVDSGHVYWGDFSRNTVTAAKVTTPYTIDWTVTGQSSPVGIATDGVHVYWANNGNGSVVRASAVDGSSVLTLATGQTGVWTVSLDATRVYWVTDVTAGGVFGVAK
jgi:hypothetical protein